MVKFIADYCAHYSAFAADDSRGQAASALFLRGISQVFDGQSLQVAACFNLSAHSITHSRCLSPQTCITRMWCSSRHQVLPGLYAPGNAVGSSSSNSFCSMLNCVLRDDPPPPLMQSCCSIVRTMCDACPVYAPPQGISHRGCVMSSAGLAFFSPGMKFRVPCFLTSCIDRDAAVQHCRPDAAAAAAAVVALQQPVPVIWHIQCSHNEREDCHSALWLQGSDVFLFVPYSVFTVVAVRLSPSPDAFM